jgi:hypothetical protein
MRIRSSILFIAAIVSSLFLVCSAAGQPPPSSAQEKKCQGLGCPIPGDEIPPPQKPTPSPTPQAQDSSRGVTFRKVFTNLPGDQKAIWTSPFHVRPTDSFWLVPLAATSGVLIGSDQHSMTRVQSNANAISRSNTISDGGLVAFGRMACCHVRMGQPSGSAASA